MRSSIHLLTALMAPLWIAACGEQEVAEVPAPQELTRAATGYYCNMIVEDHPGPKGQIFLADHAEPIWFSSVRDTVAFTLLPEEPKNIVALYVNDMGRASWDIPEAGTWIDGRSAWYVVGSRRRGGMGAPEAVPFAERAAAEAFAAEQGGSVVAFTKIPEDAILGMVEEAEAQSDHGSHTQAEPEAVMDMPDHGSHGVQEAQQ